MDRARRLGSLPIYPEMFVAAWIVGIFSGSAASAYALPRPILVGMVGALIVHLALTGMTRNRHLGALLALSLGCALGGLAVPAVAIGILVVLIAVVAVRRGRRMSSVPWGTATRFLNVVGVLTLVVATATAANAGALTPSDASIARATAVGDGDMPDIYLILLDGHPRADTLAATFGLDLEPFLADMKSLGFEPSRLSHSNYNLTALTLGSMLNMRQVRDVPGLFDAPMSPVAQYRGLARAINTGSALDALHAQGFEIVTVPSQVTNVTLYAADRVMDSGQMTEFEYELMKAGSLRRILPEAQRSWLVGQHRDRVEATFERLADLAEERADHPRFILAHIMAPHVPIAFGRNGEVRSGWPCIPGVCSIFYGGQAYGDDIIAPIRDQVAYIDSLVADTARRIQAASQHPPVIVFLSDHGGRHDFDDADEMLRSFFVAYTPGQPRLFPDDVTPVNLIPRLLDAYGDAGLPLTTEESYWVDMDALQTAGPLSFIQWPIDGVSGDP